MSPSDEELAVRAKSGDHGAFESLVAAHQRKTYGLALQLLRNPDDAADAAQEAFLRCYASLDKFDPALSFGAWLYRITYNHCLDVLRRKKRAPVSARGSEPDDAEPEQFPDPGPGVEDLVVRIESRQAVSAALGTLSDEHRRVLALRYTLDMPYSDIARTLGVAESTITMRLYHAKKALRARLARLGDDAYGTP